MKLYSVLSTTFAKKLNPFGVHIRIWQRSRCLNLFKATAIVIGHYCYHNLIFKAYLRLTTWSFSKVIILTFSSLEFTEQVLIPTLLHSVP